MKVIENIERLLFKSPVWVFVMMLYLMTLIKTGVWAIPNLSMSLELAQNPFTNPLPNPDDHYIFWSWLGNYFAWVIGARTLLSFFLFHLVCNIAFSAILIATLFSRFSDTTARKALIVFSLFPVSATAYFWVGMDSLTLLIMLLALVTERFRWMTFVLGVALGMQHFEQGTVAVAVLLLITLGSTQRRNTLGIVYTAPFCGVLLLGVIAGKLGLIALFHHYGIVIHSDRVAFLKHNVYSFFHQFFFHAQAILWAVLGLGWLIVINNNG